ncbi:Armadillo-like helical domain and Armadillo-type fold domain and Ataxin-10 domain-containing protein [Strongyloides ratti]|uniref:Armadillo-like helical domain and Armadillo-type fold domain and Ataxin-10 domain-containing protein n=1 Tax=Strongyloides ratti TaxID=34506 RepID=A0A090MXS4_STRRB|nr:Armadillo-like helical domain and Armadillo-type fold domain and Ataxin-10 domain-containing protein [Strongyloides ratti]CEF65939.1 Armadillo-like helical domain and Armadillo-type fold domain and Ataxin-10 domain-containing protein [Strongyloides ratti]
MLESELMEVLRSQDFTELTDEEIKKVNKWVCSVDIEKLDDVVGVKSEDMRFFMINVFEALLQLFEEDRETHRGYPKIKLVYRIYANFSTRSYMFRNLCLKHLELGHWFAIIRYTDILPETCGALCCYGKEFYKEYLIDENFFTFFGNITDIYAESSDKEVSSSIKAFFWKMFEEVPTILNDCYDLFTNHQFLRLLQIVKSIIEMNYEASSPVVIHEGNVSFMVSLLGEWCQDDFKDAVDLYIPLFLMESLATIVLYEHGIKKDIFGSKEVLNNIKVILTNVLCNEGKSNKMPTLSGKFKDLWSEKEESEPGLLNDLKVCCLKLLTNIAVNSHKNKVNVGVCGLIEPILQCSLGKTTLDSPLGKEWSVVCIKTLTEECPENQKILMEIKDKLNSSVLESLKEKTVLI